MQHSQHTQRHVNSTSTRLNLRCTPITTPPLQRLCGAEAAASLDNETLSLGATSGITRCLLDNLTRISDSKCSRQVASVQLDVYGGKGACG